jgi:hypothetical protein
MIGTRQTKEHEDISARGRLLMKFAIVFVVLGFLTLILAVFLFIHEQAFDTSQTINSTKFGEFGSFVSGAVGIMWSLVGIILFYVTLTLQRKELSLQRKELTLTRKELKKTAEANRQIAEDTKANAIVDLYQTYTTDYFFNLSKAAWRVLMRCMSNKEYSDYVVSTFFVSEYSSTLSDDIKETIYAAFASEMLSDDESEKLRILQIDNEERHRLDDFINFYSVLALRNAPKEIFEKCDFFYDWWRPLLWWISDKRKAAYAKDLEKQKYSTELHHLEILERLDFIYGFQTLKDPAERWNYFMNHPIAKRNKFDPMHTNPYL